MIYYEYSYLIIMAFLLVGMHIYWTLFMFKSAYNSLGQKKIVNNYDVHKNKWSEYSIIKLTISFTINNM